MERFLEDIWYSRAGFWAYLLWPVSLVYQSIIFFRRKAYQWGWLKTIRFPVPVVVVGNITVGGTGETPLIIFLAKYLKERGFQPGIVSRGYGGRALPGPKAVTPTSDPKQVGDEPVLIARHTGCPLRVGPDRVACVQQLLQETDCNLILSDDGLQHYALGRDLEIVVMDGERGVGNGFCLPAGPLRESRERLKSIDMCVVNGGVETSQAFAMMLEPVGLFSVGGDVPVDPSSLSSPTVYAVAGIGHPQRFYDTLLGMGFAVVPHSFPDHHRFQPEDLRWPEAETVIMTEKDAVKCTQWVDYRFKYLKVEARLSESFLANLRYHLDSIGKFS